MNHNDKLLNEENNNENKDFIDIYNSNKEGEFDFLNMFESKNKN